MEVAVSDSGWILSFDLLSRAMSPVSDWLHGTKYFRVNPTTGILEECGPAQVQSFYPELDLAAHVQALTQRVTALEYAQTMTVLEPSTAEPDCAVCGGHRLGVNHGPHHEAAGTEGSIWWCNRCLPNAMPELMALRKLDLAVRVAIIDPKNLEAYKALLEAIGEINAVRGTVKEESQNGR